MALTLYYHPLSSYCQKVLIALDENGTAFERRIIDLGDATQRAQLQALWPMAKFPLIRDHARQRDVAESTPIIEYLDHHFAGPRALIPLDWEAAFDARWWDRFFDNYVQAPMQQIVADRLRGSEGGPGDMSRERAILDTAYRLIETRMAGRTWAAGTAFSLADCAAAPALFYAGAVHPWPVEFGHLGAYFERLVQRDSVRRALEQARPYFEYFPFAHAIAKRFR